MTQRHSRAAGAWRWASAALVALLAFGAGAPAAQAAPPWQTEATVTSIEFTSTEVASGSDAELQGTWSLPDNPATPAGFAVELPAELQGLSDDFPLLDPQGAPMGQCTVTATQIVCDFDDAYLAAHPRNLSGTFNFWANIRTQVTEDTITTYVIDGREVTVVVTPPQGTCTPVCEFEGRPSNKTGDYDRETDTILWTVRVESGKDGAVGGESMSVDDELGPNQELLTSFQGETYPKLIHTDELVVTSGNVQQPGNWLPVPRDAYTVDGDTVSWTAEAGYYYAIQYVSRVTDAGAAGTYTNAATVTIDGNDGFVSSEVVRQGGGGTGSGDQVGRFSITKEVAWEEDAVDGIDFGGTFTVTTPEDAELAGTFSVREGETWTSDEYPTGSVVHIEEILPTEPGNLDWAAPVLSQNDFPIAGATTTAITLHNEASLARGSFSAQKVVAGDAAASLADDAEFLLDYAYPAGPGFAAGSGTLELPASGETVDSPLLPVGAVLTLSERTPAPVDGAAWTGAQLSTDTVTIGRDEAVTVTVTNTLTTVTGGLIISKRLSGAGVQAFALQDELVFDVVCTLDERTVFETTVSLEVAGRTVVDSGELGPIPANAECTVTEVDGGHADALPDPVTVIIPYFPESGTSEVVTASLTNFYSAGSVEVSKTLAGDDAAVAAVQDRVFEILVTCQVDEEDAAGGATRATVYSGKVLLRGGQTKYLVGEDGEPRALPLGTRCFGEETDDGGAAEVSIDHDSFENGATVTAGTPDELQVISISAVNTFTDAPPVPPKRTDTTPGSALAVTGGSGVGSIGLLAGGALLLGVALLLFRRSRTIRE
ncbi:DUF5979 domain-containing protein [Leucobacter allii]|uniref:DUF5979 domain-containing protein n=1 Tax=Leucobacter allii TaxID=2932247 RepID=A0ABY4FR91_9MICO|nr:DUF5979 domain-containing protein [Leucobacter allii]UOQ58782.1 DUF5979 domain-containing protein [Leucobacter allii]